MHCQTLLDLADITQVFWFANKMCIRDRVSAVELSWTDMWLPDITVQAEKSDTLP